MNNGFSIGAERSIVDSLRPRPGQEVIGAVFSTYSLDLVALLAVLLGLSGIDCNLSYAPRFWILREFTAELDTRESPAWFP